MIGYVLRLRRDRGFGFLRSDELSAEFFFHRTKCITPFEVLNEKDPVRFEMEEHERGTRAIDVERVA